MRGGSANRGTSVVAPAIRACTAGASSSRDSDGGAAGRVSCAPTALPTFDERGAATAASAPGRVCIHAGVGEEAPTCAEVGDEVVGDEGARDGERAAVPSTGIPADEPGRDVTAPAAPSGAGGIGGAGEGAAVPATAVAPTAAPARARGSTACAGEVTWRGLAAGRSVTAPGNAARCAGVATCADFEIWPTGRDAAGAGAGGATWTTSSSRGAGE